MSSENVISPNSVSPESNLTSDQTTKTYTCPGSPNHNTEPGTQLEIRRSNRISRPTERYGQLISG